MDIQELEQSLKNGSLPIWATEDTLQKVAKALNVKGGFVDLSKTIGVRNDSNPRTFIGGLNLATSHTAKLGKTAGETSKTFNAFKTVMTGSAGLVGTLATSRGKFADLNPIIGAVSTGLQQIAGDLPVVGGFFKALIGVTEQVMKLNNVIVDDLLDNFYSLGSAGFALNGELLNTQSRALDAGMSFEAFTNTIMTNLPAIIAFGGDIENGTAKFTKSLEILTKPNQPGGFMEAMKSFGYSAEATGELLGDFITMNRNNMRLQKMDETEVAQVAFEYAKNLRVLSELTGVQVDEIKANQMAQLTDGAFQSKLQQMRNRGLVDEAQAMQNFAGTMKGMSPIVEKGFKDVTAGLMTEQTALLLRTVPGLEEAFLARDAEAVRNLLAGLTQDADALQIGTFGLLDATNPLSQLINDLLPTAQYLAGIVEMGPTESQLRIQQDEQIERLRGMNKEAKTFENNMIKVATQIEQFPKKIQSMVLDNLEGALKIQMSVMSGLANMIESGMTGGILQKTTPSGLGAMILDYFGLEGGAYDTESIGDLVEYLKKNALASGGPTGGGMYLVGERGPELLRLSQGSMGHVYNHGQTKSMLRGRAGGGGVNGSDMGGMSVDAQGNQVVHMSLSPDTMLSKSASGMTEIIRSLSGGYAVGIEGGLDADPRVFTQDQNTTGPEKHYDAATMAHHMSQGYKAMTGSDHSSPEGFQEVVKAMQEQTKEMKKVFAKIASRDGYF